MKNILYIVFFLFVLLSAGIPKTGQDHNSYSDNYSLVSDIHEIMGNEDTHSDYEDGIDLNSLTSNLLPGNIKVTDTQEQFFSDKICKIFQPPR